MQNSGPGQLLSHPEQWEDRSHKAAESLPQATGGMAADQGVKNKGDGRATATSDLSWNTGTLVSANPNYNTDNTSKSKISDLSFGLKTLF